MPKIVAPLTDTQIKNAKPREKEYNLVDGKGLTLRIKPTGSKLWILNYFRPHTKKRANLSFGAYSGPDSCTGITLKRARKQREEYRDLLALDIDPKEYIAEQELKEKEAHKNTFEYVASKWHEAKKNKKKKDGSPLISKRHAEKVWESLELHIIPEMGAIPIHKLKAPRVIEVIRPIESRGNLETVARLCRRINEVMVSAVNAGIIDNNPLAGIYDSFGSPDTKHMLSIKPEQLPDLMKAINRASIKFTTRCLIEWQLHTMVRPGEAVGTRWEEIDFDNKVWNIPAERMKKNRDHAVPLSSQAIALLEEMKSISGHREYVFPGHKNPRGHANASTANMALKRMGYGGKLVAHGLRSIASTVLNEQQFDPDVIEVALAHVDKNNVRKAYNRAEYLEQRRKLMSWWSDYIVQAASGSVSVAGSKKNLKLVNN